MSVHPHQGHGPILQALARARDKLNSVRLQIPGDSASDIDAFIDAHLLMLDDSAVSQAPIQLIRYQRYSAEWALQVRRDELGLSFGVNLGGSSSSAKRPAPAPRTGLAAMLDGKPLSDDAIKQKLAEVGIGDIARRTVAKYRKILNIPTARFRKRY